ncbi:hypothetical protein F511_33713 [Dorcoceras hygrometricum]|uniref:Uncharacterized protein n=1 Tax=Dorcoceras hygrometricum TaxID=472368 RepID=A0A2Z7AX41_9LAMI|nr:hypothetical protein F511_33713 [Dorcoceras hygrometricum]
MHAARAHKGEPSRAHRRAIVAQSTRNRRHRSGATSHDDTQQQAGRVAHPTAQHRTASARPTHERRANDLPASCDQWRAIIGSSPCNQRHPSGHLTRQASNHRLPSRGRRAASARLASANPGNTGSDTTVGDPDPPPGQAAEEQENENREAINTKNKSTFYDIHRMFSELPLWHLCLAPTGCTRSPDEISTNGFSTSSWPKTNFPAKTAAAAAVA